jgi:hypothetical protein
MDISGGMRCCLLYGNLLQFAVKKHIHVILHCSLTNQTLHIMKTFSKKKNQLLWSGKPLKLGFFPLGKELA